MELTKQQTAERLGVHICTIYKFTKELRLIPIRYEKNVGRPHPIFDSEAVDRFAQEWQSPTKKKCSKCKEIKPAEVFTKNRRTCRDCINARRRIWRAKDSQRINKQRMEKRLTNKEHYNETARKWAANNREHINKTRRIYHEKNREKINLTTTKWRQKNKTRIYARAKEQREANKDHFLELSRASFKRRALKLRLEVQEVYGGKCACCGETTPEFLTIDHINNDGAQHRKETKLKGGRRFYAWLKRNGFPKDGLQLLCFNCNCGKQINGGTCPHEKREGESQNAA